MSEQPAVKKPPPPPRQPKPITVHVPSMRVMCQVCRHQSAQFTTPGRLVETELACTCYVPELVLWLQFPGQDLYLPIEQVRGS